MINFVSRGTTDRSYPLMHVLTEAVRFMKLKNFLSTVTIRSNFRSGRNSRTVDS